MGSTNELNGVEVQSARKFDSLVPWRVSHPDPANYESAIVDSLSRNVIKGDSVVIVGGGWGVTTVVAARLTGIKGSVKTFEASQEYADYVSETATINDVQGTVVVLNTVVSHTVSTRGKKIANNVTEPEEMPESEVLLLDCEGAEVAILTEMKIRPRVVIVETHGMFGASTEEVMNILESKSYEVTSKAPAERGANKSKCIANDVYVLTAVDSNR